MIASETVRRTSCSLVLCLARQAWAKLLDELNELELPFPRSCEGRSGHASQLSSSRWLVREAARLTSCE